MNAKLLTLTFLLCAIGCKQGTSGVKQKAISKNFKSETATQGAPKPMERGAGDQTTGGSITSNQTTATTTAPAPTSVSTAPAQPQTQANQTSTNNSLTAQAAATASTSINTGENAAVKESKIEQPVTAAQRSSIGNLDVRNKPTSKSENSAQNNDSENSQAKAKATPVDENSLEAKTEKSLNQSAKEAEKKQGDTRSEAEKQRWMKLVNFVANNGEKSETQLSFIASLKIETSNDSHAPRVASYLSVIGGPLENNTLTFTRVEAVWENWAAAEDGKLTCDQYMFLLSRDGNIAEASHFHFIKEKDDSVSDRKEIEVSKVEAIKKWSELLNAWYKKTESETPEKK